MNILLTYLKLDLLINDKLCALECHITREKRYKKKNSIFNFLAFVPSYKNSPMVLFYFANLISCCYLQVTVYHPVFH